MRISAKGRYALAAVTEIARSSSKNENISTISIASQLGISKIYLEQVFAQLKKGGVLVSEKGSRGGYQLAQAPKNISVWDVLMIVENALMDPAGSSVEKSAPEIAMAMQALVFDALDKSIRDAMARVSVQDLLDFAEAQRGEQAFMYYL
ncbi:MAG: Rrf2 family transcriptional regulator [Oscillospiraceae bacterium]|jgi:Rrf2 family protein|nr:Rrf2 family transcriptional regulator [Oscillospiraceae bacterium]